MSTVPVAPPPIKKYDLAAIRLMPEDVAALSAMVGFNLTTKEQLIERVKRLSTLSVGGTEITLEPGLLERLRSRALRRPIGEYVTEEVLKALHSLVGW